VREYTHNREKRYTKTRGKYRFEKTTRCLVDSLAAAAAADPFRRVVSVAAAPALRMSPSTPVRAAVTTPPLPPPSRRRRVPF